MWYVYGFYLSNSQVHWPASSFSKFFNRIEHFLLDFSLETSENSTLCDASCCTRFVSDWIALKSYIYWNTLPPRINSHYLALACICIVLACLALAGTMMGRPCIQTAATEFHQCWCDWVDWYTLHCTIMEVARMMSCNIFRVIFVSCPLPQKSCSTSYPKKLCR